MSHLNRVAVRKAGKPKHGRLSVNSVALLFTGLHGFLVKEHGREINWSRLESKFPDRVKSNLGGYYREEVQKMHKNADVWDKPIVLLEFCTWVRVGAISAMRFEDLTPNRDLPDTSFLSVYPDSERDNYHIVVTEEFLRDLQDLKDLRER